jgi:DNA-binding beta-propeller fold protein YncE
MVRKVISVVALALLLTCGPSAVTTSPTAPATASRTAIASGDVISLREGGQQSSIAVRKVATSELVRALPDGMVLPDGVTIVAVESNGASTLVKKIDRRTGATIASRTIDGVWQLDRGYPQNTAAAPDGTKLALFGSSYNFTDPSGAWTARTTFGVLDLATWRIDPIQLDGRFTLGGVSNDGRFAYVTEYTPPQLPSSSRFRVYDLMRRTLGEVGGDAVPSLSDAYRTAYVGASAFRLVTSTETLQLSPDHLQVTPVTQLVRVDLAQRTVRTMRLPISRALVGEETLAWSLVASRDGATLYVVNPAAGVLNEIDVASMQVRRTAQLNDARSEPGPLERVLAFLHPVAYAKMGFGTGAILSADGATLYVLGAKGIWSIDLRALSAKMLTREGVYETLALSPDGARLYVLGREDGVVSAVDAHSGTVLGSMERIAFPSEIVAVDAG